MRNENIARGLVHDNMNDLSLLAKTIGLGATRVRVGFEDSVYFAQENSRKHNLISLNL
jgi:hypothetical protein